MKNDVAGSKLRAIGLPTREVPTKGSAVMVAGELPPWYGRPPTAGPAVVAKGRLAEPEARAVNGTSTRMVPTVPPLEGSRVRYCVVLPP